MIDKTYYIYKNNQDTTVLSFVVSSLKVEGEEIILYEGMEVLARLNKKFYSIKVTINNGWFEDYKEDRC